jgi:NADH dehydrogenase/NADH:ubiquinone oxidoreductase subunit G
MDGLGLNIVLDIKDFNIMRIHPGLNLNLEEQFITDKIRYLYDGLKRQRLVNPMKRK